MFQFCIDLHLNPHQHNLAHRHQISVYEFIPLICSPSLYNIKLLSSGCTQHFYVVNSLYSGRPVHLRNAARIRSILSFSGTQTIVHAFIFSRLDYYNVFFFYQASIRKHKWAAARPLTRTKKTEHITPVLMTRHCLPMTFRIDLKILLIIF